MRYTKKVIGTFPGESPENGSFPGRIPGAVRNDISTPLMSSKAGNSPAGVRCTPRPPLAVEDRPLAIDLFCGLGGWTEALLAEGWNVIGFDIERHDYGKGTYPGQLVLQDVRTIHGAQFADADLIVASPPCQFFSRMAMPFKCPWKPEEFERRRNLALSLFWACFRIQHEASEAAGREIPMVLENVRGAQSWVSPAGWNFGSYYLWGDIPALMPQPKRAQKFNPDGTNHGQGSWFAIADSKNRGAACKVPSESGRRTDPGKGARFTSRDCGDEATKLGGSWFHEYRKGQGPRNHGSKSAARRAASAEIAKIPKPLASWIARVFKPEVVRCTPCPPSLLATRPHVCNGARYRRPTKGY